MNLVRSCLFILALLGWVAAGEAADLSFPALTGRINDGANLLTSESRGRIEGKLAAHEGRTGDQIVIATVPSLQGGSIEDFANQLFRFWKLGEKDRNNGILLLVAPNERKVRIEVGYGLEGALTDALSKVIITTSIAPRFKAGDFSGGIEAGTDAILNILSGDAEEWQRRAHIRPDETPTAVDFVVFALVMLVFLLIIRRAILNNASRGAGRWHRQRNGTWIPLPGPGWTGGSSNGSWGSGSDGFSGGGFSGGGGSSGGGGASGDW